MGEVESGLAGTETGTDMEGQVAGELMVGTNGKGSTAVVGTNLR